MGPLVTKLLKLANTVTTQTHIERPRLPESLEEVKSMKYKSKVNKEQKAVKTKKRYVVRNHWLFNYIIF